ncbi:hypothetical protein FRC04_006438 [Tulasnella sp. 424]|nr:hypothetical protein FRC04_006438 [Tulasnella sp. 424]
MLNVANSVHTGDATNHARPLVPLASSHATGNAIIKSALYPVTDFLATTGVRTVSRAATIHVLRVSPELLGYSPLVQMLTARIVCGEPCDLQICPTCASEVEQDQLVDLIMGTKMSEIDPNSDDLADILVTLPCRHTFTVETLDGHCDINSYYIRRDGVWSGLAPTPTDIQKSLACPLCRGPVSTKRYGRIQKRADLDMAEQEAEKSVREFDLEAESGTLAQAFVGETIREPEDDANEDEPAPAEVAKSEFIASKSLFPIDPEAICGKTWRRFGFSVAAGRAWNKRIRHLVTAYSAAVTISQERFPLLRTYDAAVSELNRYYSQQLADGEIIPINNIPFQEFALLKAKAASGFPAPPKAHLRFRVEAFWTTIDVRFKVAAMIESLTLHPNLRNSRIVEGLRAFNSFLMDCVQHDAQRAIDLSEESQSQRQVLRSALLLMRAEWQAFAVKATSLGPRERNPATVRGLIEKAEAGCIKAKQTIESRRRTFMEKMGGHPDDQTWAYENFVQPAEEIVDGWVRLKTQIQETSFGLSDEEKRQIIQALAQGNNRELPIATRGHFYRCRNGHPYVIGECGGAMQRSRCPECGETIGGGDHTLDASNSRATDFESLAGNLGVAANPWPWGQGA